MSGPRIDISKFYKGRHALVPFAYPGDLPVIAEVCQSFIFDNSAFTYWKNGKSIDVPAYIRMVEEWRRHPGFDWALIPDVIDGGEEENDTLLDAWPQRLMKHGVPVWHLHESLERLLRLALLWPRVALGSSGKWRAPGSATWWDRMREVMSVVCDRTGHPRTRLHGLRMLNPEVFSKLPLSSADSVNAAMNAGATKRFGMYPPPTAAQRATVIADRVESFNSAAVWVAS